MKKNNTPNAKRKVPESLTENTDGSSTEGFPIVGVGASAGGLEALEQFFINMPENSGITFVVIQHLSPDHKGLLSELLQRITKMKVYTVTDGIKVKPSCVYVIPSNKSMSILNGSLHLLDPIETHGLRLPIDFFFRSLADDQKETSIGIILSGMGSDGSIGLKAIKEKGGMVLVQDPASAKYDSMPRSAIEAVVTDIVAPANELPVKLLDLLKEFPRLSTREELEKDPSALDKVIILLRSQTGNDFSQYKKTTMYRRIERRMGVHQIKKIASYVRYLQENPTEADILFKELLIGVTNFFRDPEVWEQLKDKVLPAIFAKLPNRYIFRAWITGCSTGEEAYSLAIVFKEALAKAKMNNNNISFQIFATDLDYNAIEKARKGIYPANIIADVPSELLDRYFSKGDEHYRVNTEIRELIVFAPQNIIKDAPFTKLDMISCRNLLIYMDADLQKKIIRLFQFSLNPGGILLLGSSETHGAQSDYFSVINAKLRIYQHLGLAQKEELLNFPSSFSRNKVSVTENQSSVNIPDNIKSLTDQLLLQQFSHASVLVTNKGDLLYLTGNTGKYLEPSAGKANMNLFAMCRDGLRNELPTAFRKALQNFEKVVLNNVKIGTNGGSQLTDVTIQQLEKPLALKNKLLVIFADVHPEKKKSSKQNKTNTVRELDVDSELKIEIQRVKEELDSTREEMQTSQEELKSINEELQSTNEELQSANEELTTSKEEMQSLNEELQTVNVELQSKIDDSVRVNNDMDNLLNSIEIATLFLDNNLNIRQYTHPTTKLFKLKPSDIGRLFTDQVTDLNYPEMYTDTLEVQRNLAFKEKAVATCDGRWFNIRIMPYRTFDNRIDGLVITFIDITKSKHLEEAHREAQRSLHSFIDKLQVGVLSITSNGIINELNSAAEKLLETERSSLLGKNYFELFIVSSLRKQIENEMTKTYESLSDKKFENTIKTANGNKLIIEWSAHKYEDDQITFTGIIKT